MKRVLCIWLPNWPLQRILVERAELKGRQVVLYQAGRHGLQVVTCCRGAARRGVFTGMPVAEARGLFRTGADRTTARDRRGTASPVTNQREPCFQRHDPQADLLALEKLSAYCQRFSPTVGWHQTDLPDTLLLDITGCAHLYHNEQHLAERIVAELGQQDYQVRVAIADTIGAAWALARYQTSSSKSKIQNPKSEVRNRGTHGSGSFEIYSLPIEALRLDEQTVQTLRELDIYRIEQLEALPRSSLTSRFDAQVIQRLDQAMGRAAELIVPIQPHEVISAGESFEYPLNRLIAIEKVLRRLAKQILEKLVPRAAGVQRLKVRLVDINRVGSGCSVGFLSPCTEVEHLVQMILTRLGRLPVPGEIVEVQLQVTCFSRLETRQVSLLADQQDCPARRQFELLLERISSRLGEQCVLRPRLHPDAQPEYACRWETAVSSLVSKPISQVRGSESVEQVCPTQRMVAARPMVTARPLVLKSRPVPITVFTSLTEGPPIRFRWEGRDYVVSRSWGPEQITTGWWRKGPIQRDYYRIETDLGQRLWLFCRSRDRAWFLQGEFS